MSRNRIILLVFTFVVLAQLAAPAMMILQREIVLSSGKEYKFKSAPRDPYDPFRGKYITMSYVSDQVEVSANAEWERGETVYVQFTEDEDGYAIIRSVSKSAPSNTSDYLKTTVSHFDNYENEHGKGVLHVYYPFDRFYMEESKAYKAEVAYNESMETVWMDEEWDYSWSKQEWESNIYESNELYWQLKDTTMNIWQYNNTLNEYRYLTEEIEDQSELDFGDYKFSELDQMQQIINDFDYSELVKKEKEKEEIEEVPQSVAYSLVSIKNGRAVLKNVMIDDVGVKEVVESNYEEEYAH